MKPFFLIMAGYLVNFFWIIRLSRKNPAFFEIRRTHPTGKRTNKIEIGIFAALALVTLIIYLAFPSFWKNHDSDIGEFNLAIVCLIGLYDNYQAERILNKYPQLEIKPGVY